MNLKRLSCVSLGVISVLSLAVDGCGNPSQSANSSSKQAELTYYFFGTPQKDLSLVQDAMNKILKQKINATIKLEMIDPGSFEQKMNIMTAAGDHYDLVFTAPWKNNYYQNVAKGAFLPLDDLLTQYAPEEKKMVPQKIWDATRVNGKIYGAINWQIVGVPYGVSVRRDLAQKYHFDVSATKKYEDLTPFLEQIKQNEPGVTPIQLHSTYDHFDGEATYFGLDQIGAEDSPGWYYLNDPKLKVVNQFATPEYKKFVELMHSWYLKGFIRKDAASLTDVTADMKAGKYAAQISKTIKPGLEQEDKTRYGFDGITKAYGPTIITTARALATMTAISKTSQHPDLAMKFIELMATDKELYNLLAHGIEGKHYVFTVKENNVIGLPPGVTDQTVGYAPGEDWMFGNQFLSYYTDPSAVGNWEKTIKMNEAAKPAPLLGFNFNPDPVKTELAQTSSVVQQYNMALITGMADPEKTLPEFLDALNKAGVQKIIDEKQKQIDEWLKNK